MNSNPEEIFVYLAGPDVFRPDAKAFGQNLIAEAKSRGLIGLYPLDNEAAGETLGEMSKNIFAANMAMIRRCDAVIANVNAFRGTEPDSGTCFEVGVAFALGKIVILYSDDAEVPYYEKVSKLIGATGERDHQDNLIENFGAGFNLMLVEAASDIVQGSALDAMDALKIRLQVIHNLQEDNFSL